jgi:hypothetical protein
MSPLGRPKGEFRSAQHEGTPVSGWSAKLKEEFYAVIPPTVFFFIALHIVGFIRM